MKNVIYKNDYLLGTKENIWKYFKEEINKQLQDNTIDFENLKTNVNNMLEVMEEIQENQGIYNNTLLMIKENVYGDLYYKILKEDEEND